MQMKILVAQLDPTIGDFEGNTKKIVAALKRGRKEGVDLVVFPEMAICGYQPGDLLLHAPFVEESEAALSAIVPETKGIAAVIGLVRKNQNGGEKTLFNSAAVIQDGKLLGFHDKILLPNYDVFDERRYFEPGREVKHWELKGKRVAVLICEDIWQHAGMVGYTHYKTDPVAEVKKGGVDLLLNLSASPYHYQKPDMRVQVCVAAAKSLHVPVIMCCQVGGNDQLVFDGYSCCVNEKGELQQLAKGFEEEEMVVDLGQKRAPAPFHYDPVRDLYSALVLGVRDYFRKQGFKKACLGLSGGIDSALVACIAVEALGKENVQGVMMPSRYSSEGSITDAELLGKNLGIELIAIPIEKIYGSYLETLEPHFKGKPFDVTEENLQARIRGTLLMALSNKYGSLLLSTGNKSEMALGYCTLYGDMAGGLAVISDVTKMQVYALANWINRQGEVIPRSTVEKTPSAELRPNQKDTDTLPEYPVIDAVLQGYVEDLLSPEEIARKHTLPLPVVEELIHRIYCAEYKRRQAPPGIRVSRRAFRAGRRYPIVQNWK
jgi:NAD+ synthase (glutamine-hydrolysing)